MPVDSITGQPEKQSEVDYKTIMDKVEAHFKPKLLPNVQRFHFNTRSRQPSEMVSIIIVDLHRLAEYCEFQDTEEMQ